MTFLELLQETKSFMPNEIFLQNAAMSRLKSILSNFGFFLLVTLASIKENYGKLWSVSLDNFIKHNPFISEECFWYYIMVVPLKVTNYILYILVPFFFK